MSPDESASVRQPHWHRRLDVKRPTLSCTPCRPLSRWFADNTDIGLIYAGSTPWQDRRILYQVEWERIWYERIWQMARKKRSR